MRSAPAKPLAALRPSQPWTAAAAIAMRPPPSCASGGCGAGSPLPPPHSRGCAADGDARSVPATAITLPCPSFCVWIIMASGQGSHALFRPPPASQSVHASPPALSSACLMYCNLQCNIPICSQLPPGRAAGAPHIRRAPAHARGCCAHQQAQARGGGVRSSRCSSRSSSGCSSGCCRWGRRGVFASGRGGACAGVCGSASTGGGGGAGAGRWPGR